MGHRGAAYFSAAPALPGAKSFPSHTCGVRSAAVSPHAFSCSWHDAAQEPIGEQAQARLAQAWGYLFTQRLQASAQRAADLEGAGAQAAPPPPPGQLSALPDDLR